MTRPKIFIKDLRIKNILERRRIVQQEYQKGMIIQTYYETNSLKDRLNFDRQLFKEEAPLKIIIRKLPPTKEVILFHPKSSSNAFLLIRRTRSKHLYYLLDNYNHGVHLVSRADKYKNLYIVYEDLVKNIDLELKSIRHALSHPKLTDKKVLMCLKKLFGDTKIDFNKSKHNKIFKQKYIELYERTTLLLIKLLWRKWKNSKVSIGKYKIV